MDALADLLALRDATLDEALDRFPESETVADAGYGQMTGLTQMPTPAGILYFRDGAFVVGRVRLADPAEAGDVLGADAQRLRSPMGKRAWVSVDAGRGVALTEDDGRVVMAEAFPPTTFEDYRDRIHRPAPHFVE